MGNEVAGLPYGLSNDKPLLQPCAPHAVMERLGDKWTVLVLAALLLAPGYRLRSAALKGAIDGISQRMLTLTVRQLERDGLLTRHLLPAVPPRVDYELTPMGLSLLPALETFTGWIRDNWPAMQAARADYDRRMADA